MPRKKVVATEQEVQPVPSEAETSRAVENAPLEAHPAKPKSRRAPKAAAAVAIPETPSEQSVEAEAPEITEAPVVEVSAQVEAVAEVAPEKPAAKKPSRKKEAPAEAPQKTVKKPSKKEVAVEAAPEPVAEAPAKKSRKSKPAPVEVVAEPDVPAQVEPEFADPDGTLTITFRPLSAVPAQGAPAAREGSRQGRGPKQQGREAKPAPTPAPKPPVVVEAEPPAAEVELGEDSELTILMWRPKGDATPAPKQVSEERDGQRKGGREQRGRDNKFREEKPVAAAPVAAVVEEKAPEPVVVATPAPTPLPVVPKKLAVPVPSNAPQIVMKDGVPQLVRDHRVYPPIIFFGNAADERRAEIVFDELKMAAESGVHLHAFLVELCVDPKLVDESAGIAGYLLSKAIQIDPEAQVIFRLEFQSPRAWEDKFPDAVFRTESGQIAEPSVCDEKYWNVADECLTLFVKKILLLDGADHIFGLHLERGEWFQSADQGFDNSRAATKQFQNWARRRYLNDEVTLRASWFDGSVRFDSITVPEFNPEGLEGDHFIRSSRKQRRYVDYHLFLSDETVSRISDLAYTAKSASGGMFVVGVSYGYTFEWTHPASGHLALGKLLRTDEIDFIAGPPSYRNRGVSGSAPFPCPIDSFALNGKLYISEEDFKTSLSRGHEPDDFNQPLRTPQALESVHWRGAGAALAHGSGVEWMDLWGNGWLKTHSVWERAAIIRDALIDRMEVPLGEPDVAVFIDERALAYLVDSNAFNLLVQSVRESVLRAGVSAGFYLLSDLQHREKFPESKLYLFLNAWDIRPELRAAIKARLQRDNKVLFWLYSAGLFDAGRESLERAREVTGIALKPQPFHSRAGTTILNRRHPLVEAFPERSLAGETKMEPSYFAIPENGVVLGEYTQTGLPSFVVKEFREDPSAAWTSVFLGEPVVNPGLIRALAQMAGAHVWNFHEDVVHVRGPFCTVHCSVTGPRTITFPNRSCAYNLLTGDWVAMDATSLKFYGIDGSTHVFLVGQKGEIENFLEKDPAKVLRMETIPVREANVRLDTANFDVPIMKLDEWIEGGDQDEVADEWFLRPQALLEETETVTGQAEESPEEVGKRRRKRKRSRGGDDGFQRRPSGGQGEATTVTVDDDEPFTMNVVFRKRD